LIRRSSKEFIDNLLDINPNWNVLDIGCGYSAHKDAKVVCDIQDLSSFYKDKNFIKLSEGNLPFKDKEFDFVISSHVIEHVQDVALFIKELERVSSKGYIELPTVLEDNLVFENKKDHLWQMWFDDDNSKLIISKRVQFIEPILTVSSVKKFSKYFRQSMVIELFWENSIDFNIQKINEKKFEKLSRMTLFRKFFSKLLRNLIK
jgi:ubiquinone/menaquinone biosynthesis C-methylase UbiE|tara:strand:- start:71 stop:682 length:612 start_codon:yes stop_codon:yes gene_type:complete